MTQTNFPKTKVKIQKKTFSSFSTIYRVQFPVREKHNKSKIDLQPTNIDEEEDTSFWKERKRKYVKQFSKNKSHMSL